ncbi:5-formyltetrahydrofolate cyclo-ligase [Arsenophonus nasoniae]|nr:5-formyltetrahydrofolate cyclo-ligase [Arsenophonus nasoniae]QBY44590.1 5-formyltetrahydrofolate cyclo-ligase [Arsenophonus nasoniae]WGM00801.1 5-formyltetrahydrofolate cyclo-ligase [Arsenophonus nasoniae]WGM04836.1 5-formyltetrahydrofolate cyclo-ligase [Arsenophonus nasoniae]WGM09936.1 5-formyltetrahydrofolate cyclo-ligase [Arsenophonus nasoniae]WGM14654.1 5-formyltetrahydrofolate cyclo-ligase [Arsenophonus nasoniae]
MSNNVQKRQKIIRQTVRQYRRQLTCEQQNSAADKITHLALAHEIIRSASHLGLFLSFDGEINTNPLIKNLWAQNKKVYLPVLHPFSRYQLLFLNYRPDTLLIKNRFNIAEPTLNVMDVIPITQLDVLFVPLVAFDKQGQRLGMGGGFYDRLLSDWHKKHFYPIGLAHDCQLVDKIPTAPWDIPLPEIITPSKRWRII